MTEVSFHFNVPERIGHLCRLVRKSVRGGSSMVLTGPGPILAHLDRALWTFDELEFLPHRLLVPGESMPARSAATRVWLVQDATQVTHHQVLVNVGADVPVGFQSFEKLIEVVTTDPEDRALARERWKHYASRGYGIERHEFGA